MPVFHEEENIKSLSIKISKDLKNLNYLICFIDGSRNDKTKNAILKYFKELQVEKDEEFKEFERYFANFYNFCFDKPLDNMLREAINFKL